MRREKGNHRRVCQEEQKGLTQDQEREEPLQKLPQLSGWPSPQQSEPLCSLACAVSVCPRE